MCAYRFTLLMSGVLFLVHAPLAAPRVGKDVSRHWPGGGKFAKANFVTPEKTNNHPIEGMERK